MIADVFWMSTAGQCVREREKEEGKRNTYPEMNRWTMMMVGGDGQSDTSGDGVKVCVRVWWAGSERGERGDNSGSGRKGSERNKECVSLWRMNDWGGGGTAEKGPAAREQKNPVRQHTHTHTHTVSQTHTHTRRRTVNLPNFHSESEREGG